MAAGPRGSFPSWLVSVLCVGAFLSLVGVAFLVFAPKTDHLTSEGEGVVTRVEKDTYGRKGRKKTSYVTYVQFEDSDHQTFEAMSVVNGSSKRHSVGDHVTVRFDPRDPTAGCLILGDEDRLGIFLALKYVFIYGGGATLLVGIVALIIRKLRMQLT